jgi:hypothetical protein
MNIKLAAENKLSDVGKVIISFFLGLTNLKDLFLQNSLPQTITSA